MSEGNSYRQILRSSSIIGGASVVNILVGLLRAKVAAVLLGPAGLGLIGILQSLMATASAASALGFGTVGTRQIAEAIGREDVPAVGAARRALFWGTLVLSALGGTVFWLLRDDLAANILGDPGLSGTVGWLAIGVALTVGSGSQGALLNGLRRIGDIARVSVFSAFLSTALGVGALWAWGESGVVAFVIAAPLASFALGHWFVSRLPKAPGPQTPFPLLATQWRALVRLGAPFMVAGLGVAAGQLVVRAMVQDELGAESVGHFQAAWLVSMTYIGFVLQAMGTDYYPRLTAAIGDHAAANLMVNEQVEVALLLAGPVLIAMMGLAPWIIELLYSMQFSEAVVVLRWHVLGDILKVMSWPLGYLILAAGDGRTFLVSESLAVLVLASLTWLGLPLIGLSATGVAFFVMYLVYLPIVYFLARRRTGFTWKRRNAMHLLLVMTLASVVFIAALWSKWCGVALGGVAALFLGGHGLMRLATMTSLPGPLAAVASVLSNTRRGRREP